MIDKSLFIKVRNTLLVMIAVFVGLFMIEGALIYLINTRFTPAVYNLMEYSVALMSTLTGLTIISLEAIYLIRHRSSRKLEKVFKRGSLISIILLFGGIVLFTLTKIQAPMILGGLFSLLFIPFTLYVFYDHKMDRINLIMIAGFFLGLVFKRLHFPFSGVLLFSFCINIVLGMIVYFYNCLFTIEKNKYLKLVSMSASLIIAFGFLSVLFLFNNEMGGGVLLALFYSPMVVLTIIVLLTLPSSKFVSWKKSHREVLTKKLLLLWITLLLFGSLRYILPEHAFNTVFVKEIRQTSPFGMYDYDLEEKNVLVNESKK